MEDANVPLGIHLKLENVSDAVPFVINNPNVDDLSDVINKRYRVRHLPLRLRLLQRLGP